jgi:hypothetical protein
MMICGVLIFSERVPLARLRATLDKRFLSFKRFRQRVAQTPAGAYWETDPAFDLAVHVKRVVLPGRAAKVELEALASKLMSTPLDSARPLWQFHLVERFNGGSAVIVRIHHCYADGIALIQVMLSMTDADRAGRAAGPGPPTRRRGSNSDDPLARLLSWLPCRSSCR